MGSWLSHRHVPHCPIHYLELSPGYKGDPNTRFRSEGKMSLGWHAARPAPAGTLSSGIRPGQRVRTNGHLPPAQLKWPRSPVDALPEGLPFPEWTGYCPMVPGP